MTYRPNNAIHRSQKLQKFSANSRPTDSRQHAPPNPSSATQHNRFPISNREISREAAQPSAAQPLHIEEPMKMRLKKIRKGKRPSAAQAAFAFPLSFLPPS